MSEWKTTAYQLNELGDISRGRSRHRPRDDESLYGGKYPFVQTGDVKNANFYLTSYSQTYNEKGLSQSKLWKAGTLCITIAANIAETSILGIDACFPDSIVGFTPYEGIADVRYVKYYFDIDKMLKVKFIFPDYTTQTRIADILSAYDDAIENNNRRIALLEKAARELYREWFVRMRFPGWESVSLVNGLPEGWEVKRLRDFGQIETGKTPPTENQDNYGDEIMFVKTPDMHGDMFVISTGEYLSESGHLTQPKKLLSANSIMVSCIGTGGVVAINAEKAHTNQQINSIVPNDKRQMEWLYFTCKGLKETIELFGATGTTMTNLSKGKFERLKVIQPRQQIIEAFHEKTKDSFALIKLLMKQSQNLARQRDLLLPRLMSGKLEV